MDRIVYLNGEWLPEKDAKISIFDRGFTFADAVYEVTAVLNGKLIDYPAHSARLQRSLSSLEITLPVHDDELLSLHREAVARNNLRNGLIYLQISRGSEDRDFVFSRDLKPTFVMYTQEKDILANPKWQSGLKYITVPDGRWANRQIKTVQLLYSSLAKQHAHEAGVDDVLFEENGYITEASGSNFHIVSKEGVLITRELSNSLLHGVTRGSILELARTNGMPVEERAFTLSDVYDASEAFSSSATGFVTPVVSVNGRIIGDGLLGNLTNRLRNIYIEDRLVRAF